MSVEHYLFGDDLKFDRDNHRLHELLKENPEITKSDNEKIICGSFGTFNIRDFERFKK